MSSNKEAWQFQNIYSLLKELVSKRMMKDLLNCQPNSNINFRNSVSKTFFNTDSSFEFEEYLLLLSKVDYPYTCDGELLVSREEMRRRISLIEKFIKNHEIIPDSKKVQEILKAYMNDYSNGLEALLFAIFRTIRKFPTFKAVLKNF
ncbi:hypothetical protein LEP1GSC050_0719 [Leptospira broomii serovar Hurstbridge str. 5399]|uniref:Uncharacterized protein n=1 Tax=Leptospira broomii serovar Hurstbridge str. 5399 TaxID=1049789 RepID=T0FHX0_9LEPT|nr:hypothetical protein LEP1GSC050_0719 [Leptospira broomii serovar Hurstbridge str. 5399]